MLRLLRAALTHPLRWLASTLLLTLIFGLGLAHLELRTDGAAIYPTGNPTVELTEEDRWRFKDPEQVILLLTAKNGGPTLQSPAGLRTLKEVHGSLAELPAVQKDGIRSLATLLDPPYDLRPIRIRNFLDELPTETRPFADLLRRIHDHPVVHGLFLSADGKAAALSVPLADGHRRADLVVQLEAWIEARGDAAFEMRLTGPLIAEALLGRTILRDLAWLVPLMVTVMAALLYFSLRTLGGVLIPMAEALVVLIWTLGAMAFFSIPITLVTTILPILLMTMAVTDEVHLLERFQAHLRSLKAAAGNEKDPLRSRRAMETAAADVARPIILTSLTTSLGFLSFLSASMAPIRHFGLFSALGILLAMILSFTFIPALVMLLPVSWFEPRLRKEKESTASLMPHERFIAQKSSKAFRIGLLLLLISLPGALGLEVQDSWVDNFDPDSTLVTAARDFNANFWGSYRLDLVLTSEQEDFFNQAEGLRLLEEATEVATSGTRVGGIASHLIPLRIIARVLDHKGSVSSQPATTLERITRLARIYKKRIDLRQFLLADGRTARLRLFVNDPDFRQARSLRDHLDREIQPLLAATGVRYHVSGDLPVAVEVVEAIVSNQLRSIGWTAAGIALLLIMAFGSARTAVILLVPLFAAISMILGWMGYGGFSLGIASSMFTALALGVGVDFALHFSHAYRRARDSGRGHESAVRETLSGAGRALRWNVTVLALSFLVLTFSALRPNHSLGLLLAAAMLTCYGATLLFLPALLQRSLGWRGREP